MKLYAQILLLPLILLGGFLWPTSSIAGDADDLRVGVVVVVAIGVEPERAEQIAERLRQALGGEFAVDIATGQETAARLGVPVTGAPIAAIARISVFQPASPVSTSH
ncbi:MAG: hypothetical protein MJE77_42255 [Proteobacteria bacterium]|nr:hypothetical protein [Pseudomonadota bacterium]